MQKGFINSLLGAISEPRFGRYLEQAGGNNAPVGLAYYLWNIQLSESLYSALQGVEITLRNSIHEAASGAFGNTDWFKTVLVAPETHTLENVRSRLASQGKAANPDNLVSALSFGFWVSLFYSRYDRILWPQLLMAVFPYMPRTVRTRGYVAQRLRRIRHLRNRVFHHEPVWHWPDLAQHHREVLEAIGWINPDMLALAQSLDRFPEVYALGADGYREAARGLGGRRP